MIDSLLEELDSCLYCWEAIDICKKYKSMGLDIQWKVYRENLFILEYNGDEYTYYIP